MNSLPIEAVIQDLPGAHIKHNPSRPYRPQTNGKAERSIQTSLRE